MNNKNNKSNMKYYVYHSTNIENLLMIIKSKILYANRYIDDKYARLSQTEKLPYIYASIYTNDNFIKDNFGISLIFHPDILNKEPFIFNYGWLTHPTNKSIYVYNDTNKINEIINKVKNYKKITDHELLFIGRIILKDYLIGIHCPIPECNNETNNIIKKALEENGFMNVKIYNDIQMPEL